MQQCPDIARYDTDNSCHEYALHLLLHIAVLAPGLSKSHQHCCACGLAYSAARMLYDNQKHCQSADGCTCNG